jgi:hypothetical protein
MNTYDVSHESTSMYVEQNTELKTFGLLTPRHHAITPLGYVPLDNMKRKTLRLCTPWHHEMKDPWAAYPWVP